MIDQSISEGSGSADEAGQHDPLLAFVADVAGDEFLKIEEDLGAGFVRLKVAEAERRQAKHDIRSSEDIVIELLRNSRDAGARHLFVATTLSAAGEEQLRFLTVIDDGMGVPASLAERIFEPRVTSKLTTMVFDEWGVHGRGMALYSIQQNTKAARLAAGGTGLGTAIAVEAAVDELGERADQSTWPKVERVEQADGRVGGGTVAPQMRVVSGPHNLIRRVVEFACAHPKLKVYLGSPNEILATLVAFGQERPKQHKVDEGDVEQSTSTGELPLCLRPAAAVVDAVELMDCAADLGLDVSERSAYRVARGEIAAVRDVRALATSRAAYEGKSAAGPDLTLDRRGLKIDTQDLSSFQTEVERAFDALAEKYYLNAHDEPKVRLSKNTLTVSFHFDKE